MNLSIGPELAARILWRARRVGPRPARRDSLHIRGNHRRDLIWSARAAPSRWPPLGAQPDGRPASRECEHFFFTLPQQLTEAEPAVENSAPRTSPRWRLDNVWPMRETFDIAPTGPMQIRVANWARQWRVRRLAVGTLSPRVEKINMLVFAPSPFSPAGPALGANGRRRRRRPARLPAASCEIRPSQ